MVKERALVLQQLVVALVEAMLLGEGEVTAEQVANRAVIKPVPVQTPLLRAASRRSPLRGSLRRGTSSLGSLPGSISR